LKALTGAPYFYIPRPRVTGSPMEVVTLARTTTTTTTTTITRGGDDDVKPYNLFKKFKIGGRHR
jgi:hypothetical protein